MSSVLSDYFRELLYLKEIANRNEKFMKLNTFSFVFFIFFCSTFSVLSGQTLEHFGRGEIALLKEEGNVFISWRLLTGDKTEAAFDIYRRDIGNTGYLRINPSPVSRTNYVDEETDFGRAYEYRVMPSGKRPEEHDPGAYVFTLRYARPYLSIKLKTGDVPRNVGIADLDGDGRYDYVIKYPDFNVDPWYTEGY
jgi:rhamnogalacturonan endolyase